MKKDSKLSHRIINSIVLIDLLIIFGIVSARLILVKLSSYIEENGKNNMATVMEQISQSYDIQVDTYFKNIEEMENLLFQNEKREITLDTCKEYFDVVQQDNKELLFMKNNGDAMTTRGQKTHLDMQNQMLIQLKQDQRIAQSVTLNLNNKTENYFLVALPCEEYTVDGESYNAIAALFDRSKIDTLLELNGYGGEAYIFLVDENGIVSYTNQSEDVFYRNYAVLKHIKQEKVITDDEYNSLVNVVSRNEKKIDLFESTDRPFYLGCYPVSASGHRLICIVPRTTVNNSLLQYQRMMVHLLVAYMWIIVLLSCGLLFYFFKLRSSNQKMAYEEEKRQIQEQALKQLEIEKEKADEANHAKTDFLANMSHDIRTPMNAIVGITNLMEHENGLSEQMKNYIQKVQTSSHHLLSLINDILDMTRIESKEVHLNEEEISLAEQVSQIDSLIRPQAEENEQEFQIRVKEVVHEYVIGDSVRLRQIALNLLSNAVKYTPKGGKIIFELTEIPSHLSDQATYIYSVIDNGYGMSEEFLKHIYEPFTRAENSITNKVQGTGLGMAITKNIVDLMGGKMHVRSELEKGSRFDVEITLPVNTKMSCEIGVQRVLLVSDEQQLIRNVEAAISETEIQFSAVSTEKEAEEWLKQENTDVILLAGCLKEKSLSETVRLLRKIAKNAILIFCLDFASEKYMHDLLEKSGVDGMVLRPFFLSNLALAIARTRTNFVPGKENLSILNGKKFLCAEDNELNADILQELLNMYGASCTIYSDGKKLVEAFENVHANEYDAILMDVQMPNMNGYEATRAIRNSNNPLGKSIPIIAMTANAFAEDVQHCIASGMNAHIAKPIDVAVLENTLRKFTIGQNNQVKLRK